jgi:hypothetical protein
VQIAANLKIFSGVSKARPPPANRIAIHVATKASTVAPTATEQLENHLALPVMETLVACPVAYPTKDPMKTAGQIL